MRRKLIAANWKMHGSSAMAQNFVSELSLMLEKSPVKGLAYDVLLCPAMPYLGVASSAVEKCGSAIKVGAQTVNEFEQGAYTGETSLGMLQDLGVQYSLVGHSERREIYGETNELVAAKFVACVGVTDPAVRPILCMGETIEQRKAGQTESVIAEQLASVINAAGIEAFAKADIAYEPVWAIGTGETATPAQAQSVHQFIRAELSKKSESVADSVRILYGGSVKPVNAAELFSQQDIDGGLVGGASLDVESFAAICKAAE
ncbi:MAG: triose-phosphate isomerase [Arenicella sp.]|nr:triose-phosphate isomerase [Arenicella sp.]